MAPRYASSTISAPRHHIADIAFRYSKNREVDRADQKPQWKTSLYRQVFR